jgi:hypothetical protein
MSQSHSNNETSDDENNFSAHENDAGNDGASVNDKNLAVNGKRADAIPSGSSAVLCG